MSKTLSYRHHGKLAAHQLCMHVDKTYQDGVWYFETHGDNNAFGVTERFSEEYLIGRVVAVISRFS
ncbi:MAG: hypothetical protein OEX77_05435 [Candidatus Bathyarchaeota archaeon]|nr:hypothetical protein [Candidatus Bathyarchaeota archaeon]